MKISEFKEHPIFEKLGLLESTIANKDNADKMDLEILDFFKASCSFIRTQLDKALTSLINSADLTPQLAQVFGKSDGMCETCAIKLLARVGVTNNLCEAASLEGNYLIIFEPCVQDVQDKLSTAELIDR